MPFAPFVLLGISLLALIPGEPELILPGEREAVLPKLTSVQIDDAPRDEGAKLGNVIYDFATASTGHSGVIYLLNGHLRRLVSSIRGRDDISELAQPIS